MSQNAGRPPNQHDRPCDGCGKPMIGIMKCSDHNHYTAPRTRCEECK